MSILLEAVTRAKQQDSTQTVDPVLTPRSQYQQLNEDRNSGLFWGMLSLIGLLLLVLIGLLILLIKGQWSQVSLPSEERTPSMLVEAHIKNLVEAPVEIEPLGGVKLASKVALPVAVRAPTRSLSDETRVASQAIVQTSPSMSSRAEPEQPAIILGANANDMGRKRFAELELQVNRAAKDLGVESTHSVASRSDPVDEAKQYQSQGNLMAAFAAALKEVEVENSIATPVSQPEVDPIPTPKQDNLPKYGQLPAGIQLQVPEFNINAHVYSSNPNSRWLNVDGAELQQGDMIGGKLTIVEIRPRDVVLAVDGTEFKVPAI